MNSDESADLEEVSEKKYTPEQEAALQRHLRHQAGMRSREGQPATKAASVVAKGCGVTTLIILVISVGLVVLIFKVLMSMTG